MRIYKRKDGARKYKSYNTESLQEAIKAVQEGKYSVKKAAELYGVNRTTLLYHSKGGHKLEAGRPTILTNEEEKLLVHSLQKLADWGFGIDRDEVRYIVAEFIKDVKRKTPFKNNVPGYDWSRLFENRWKHELSRRVGQNLPANRAEACNTAVIEDFFNKLNLVVERLGLRHKPANIFNVDETGFQTDIGRQKLLCRKGTRNPHKTVGSTTKTMYTVQTCCSADGKFLPPYVVFKGKHLYQNWCEGGPPNTRYNVSPSGWMEAAQFQEWFEKVFIADTKEIDGPKLLVFDGHSSHLSLQVINLATENNIEMLCLPAHTSHILQPLDVGVFKAVKSKWRTILRSHYDATRHKVVDKATFPKLLRELYNTDSFARHNAISGFEACGIYPLNRQKISSNKLVVSEPFVDYLDQNDEACLGKLTEQSVTPSPSPSCSFSSPSSMQSPSYLSCSPRVIPSPSSDLHKLSSTLPSNPASSTRSRTETVQVDNVDDDTPRKKLSRAILSHLQRSGTAKSTTKRTRVRRTLAECLTEEEVRQRIENEEIAKAEKKSKLKRGFKKKTATPSDTSEDELEVLPTSKSSDASDEEVQLPEDAIKGDWVLCKFSSDKRALYYVGEVLELHPEVGEVSVKFVRLCSKTQFLFQYPDIDDIGRVGDEQILKVLSEPKMDRRQRLFFQEKFDKFNMY